MQEFLSDGVRLAFLDFAPTTPDKGQPIILIHGFASNHGVNWVFPQWVKTLTHSGRRTIVFDNRGHGRSEKLHDPKAYSPWLMAADAANLLDHLGIARADVMGYSMGARIAAHMAAATPEKVRGLVLAGLGIHLVDGEGLPAGIADAMEAPSLEDLTDPMQRMFRAFAEATRSDLVARRLHARLAPRPERGRGRNHRDADADLRRLGRRRRRRSRAAGAHDAERKGFGHCGPRPQSRGRRQGL